MQKPPECKSLDGEAICRATVHAKWLTHVLQLCTLNLCGHYFPVWPLLSCVSITFLCGHYFPVWLLLSCVAITFLCGHYFPAWVLLSFLSLFSFHLECNCFVLILIHGISRPSKNKNKKGLAWEGGHCMW